jgi:poly(3-hydroxybutyrate) depolymerase
MFWSKVRRLLILPAAGWALSAQANAAKEIQYLSSADDTKQPAFFYAPPTKTPVPLLVGLHTWSGNYKQKNLKSIEQWCIQKGWAYIYPDFRGPNKRPEATGSDLVVADIVSAVDYASKSASIDRSAIYLVGASGGGYTALLMAGRRPELWAGVSAWVPITDLEAWYRECKKANRRYFKDIAASCGGAPGAGPEVDAEYLKRSPLTYLKQARSVDIQIGAGIHDGHKGSVPVSHALRAFNELVKPRDRISNDHIGFMVEKAAVPPPLSVGISDPAYGRHPPLFRRSSGHAEITLFDGGHQIIPEAATDWIQRHYQKRKSHD